MWYSQSGQDQWVAAVTKQPGYFVDLGAYDGVQTSNTLSLEKLGWVGICVEANSEVYERLVANRPDSININAFVNSTPGAVRFRDQWQTLDESAPLITAMTLDQILDGANAPKHMGYLSMDIEGGEVDVLLNFSFNYTFDHMTIEHNLYADGPSKKDAIYEILTAQGYIRVVDNALCLDPNPAYHHQPYEDWYSLSYLPNA